MRLLDFGRGEHDVRRGVGRQARVAGGAVQSGVRRVAGAEVLFAGWKINYADILYELVNMMYNRYSRRADNLFSPIYRIDD